VYGTRGYEHETASPDCPGGFDQLQGANQVLLNELDQVSLGATKTCSGSVERRVDHSVAAVHQRLCAGSVAQVALDPLYIAAIVESAPIAGRPMPAAKRVALSKQMPDDVSADESGGAGQCNTHHIPFRNYSFRRGPILSSQAAQLPEQIHLAATGETIWIITEAVNDQGQRASTTILLPDEY
jgi:hypothetical protein